MLFLGQRPILIFIAAMFKIETGDVHLLFPEEYKIASLTFKLIFYTILLLKSY